MKLILTIFFFVFSLWSCNGQAQRQEKEAYYFQQLKTAEQGNADAQFYLGVLYQNGHGVLQDYKVARQWYKKAAKQGHALAQYNLGVLYAGGQGVRQDYTAARQWWEKAVKQGYVHAQNTLGVLYANGLGVPQDYKVAYVWFNVAAAQGGDDISIAARKDKDLLSERLDPVTLSKAQAISKEYYEKYVAPFQ